MAIILTTNFFAHLVDFINKIKETIIAHKNHYTLKIIFKSSNDCGGEKEIFSKSMLTQN